MKNTPPANNLETADDAHWQAVVERNRDYDGKFVYAVTSTGIFCRPTCPARRPLRANVRFFATASAAAAAGFRPCRRCRPTVAAAPAAAANRAGQACRLIEANPDTPPSLTTLGRQVGVAPTHLQRSFKQTTGISPRQYTDAVRAARFKGKVRGAGGIIAAQGEAGYGSSRALYEHAAAELGMTPATYRRGGKGVSIVFTISDCPLGKLLVAATDKGICSVTLGDDEKALAAGLQREFPEAAIAPADARLAGYVRAIVRHLEGKAPHLDLPLDIRATAFQRQVWQALQNIPYGETRSYGEVAAELGNPKAVRAVARACASNPVALAIPCHRVIGGNGSLTGYRWGVERKQKLLEKENKTATS